MLPWFIHGSNYRRDWGGGRYARPRARPKARSKARSVALPGPSHLY